MQLVTVYEMVVDVDVDVEELQKENDIVLPSMVKIKKEENEDLPILAPVDYQNCILQWGKKIN